MHHGILRNGKQWPCGVVLTRVVVILGEAVRLEVLCICSYYTVFREGLPEFVYGFLEVLRRAVTAIELYAGPGSLSIIV